MVLAVAISRYIQNSWIGRGLQALRDDELAAECTGVPTLRLKLLACAISGALMCAAGAPPRCTCNTLTLPSAFNLNYSVSALAMSLIGGTAHWAGPIIGAILLSTTQQLLTVTISSEVNVLVLGVMLVLFVVAAPEGIIGLIRRVRRNRKEGEAMMPPENPSAPAADHRRSPSVSAASRRSTMSASRSAPRERFGLIGPNGSGKTTLINCISGAFRTEPGTVMFRDEDITRLQPHMRTRRGIARSFQIPRPFKSMTVAENLMVALDFAVATDEPVSAAQRRDTMMSILTQMGLASKADVSVTKLSQVELRKMELARAMATHPKLLISDEAMAGLSSSEVDEVLDLLMSLADHDITIIMIEHIMQAVMRFSDRVMCLDAGRIIAIGTPSEVMANQRVQEAYSWHLALPSMALMRVTAL